MREFATHVLNVHMWQTHMATYNLTNNLSMKASGMPVTNVITSQQENNTSRNTKKGFTSDFQHFIKRKCIWDISRE